ncbi:MAG: hypothetical protein AAF570_03430, partial [Bacteroidota bacterium]
PNSPFQNVVHNEFFYDRQMHEYLAHPQWETIGAEGLLVKILYANYDHGYAVIEMFGVWNDLIQNDYKLFAENCLTYLIDAGIDKFVLVVENVLNIYLDRDDYYEAVQDEIGAEGWICLLRPREHVVRELEAYDIGQYFYWSEDLDDVFWRKLKPWQLYGICIE